MIPPTAVNPPGNTASGFAAAAPVSPPFTEIRHAALDALSRREYSRQELREKLAQKFKAAHPRMIESVLDDLAATGLQSDVRYVEMFARARRQRGCGPLRIEQELKYKGIAVECYAELIDRHSESWIQAAREVRIRRFGMVLPSVLAERARQQKFLLYRGFSQEQVRRALSLRD